MFVNSKILAVLLVIVCAIGGAFLLLPKTSAMLSYEQTASYDYASASFTNASFASAPHDDRPMAMSGMKSYRSSIFRHRGTLVSASSCNVSSMTQTYAANSGSAKDLYTVSSAKYHSFGGGNVGSGQSGMTRGANSSMIAQASSSISAPIYSTAGASSVLGQISSADMTVANADASALAMSSVYSSYSSVYAGSMASGYQTVANGSVFGNFGGKGPMRAAPNLGQTEIGGFFDWLISQGLDLYREQAPDKYGDNPDELFWWFSQSGIEDWFQKYLEACRAAGVTPQFNDWKDLMSWFNSEGNTQYRFPLPDGTIFLLVLLVGYSLFLYFRSRKRNDIVE